MDIPQQTKLPINIAMDVVLQGIRIRMGRSIVTMMGVVLGVAFLMSTLSNGIARKGVSLEIETRQQIGSMLSFLEKEIGSIPGKTIVAVELASLDTIDQRFLSELKNANITLLQLSEVSTANPLNAVLLVGQGSIAREPFASMQVPLISTQILPETGYTSLQIESNEVDIARAETKVRRAKARSIWIISIAVLVTIIGISNALLMSVTERFREIGTMKCLGALSGFIRQIFFLESSLIGLIGAFFGALIGAIFSIAAYGFSFGFGQVLGSLSWTSLGIAFLICLVAGSGCAIVAAIYPASVAARMTPATALRSNV